MEKVRMGVLLLAGLHLWMITEVAWAGVETVYVKDNRARGI